MDSRQLVLLERELKSGTTYSAILLTFYYSFNVNGINSNNPCFISEISNLFLQSFFISLARGLSILLIF